MEQWTGSKLGKEYIQAAYCHPAYLTYIRVHLVKCQAKGIKSWNQDWWDKYQQPHIWRLFHSNGKEQRGTKELLEEGERGECKT